MKLGRSWEEAGKKLGRSWEEAGKKLGRSWEEAGKLGLGFVLFWGACFASDTTQESSGTVEQFADSSDGVQAQASEDRASSLRSVRIAFRYTTPEGVGYHKGYTTAEGFFAPPCPINDTFLPFLDVRGHIFDDGRWAANAGLGLRVLKRARIFGINAYYDYRNTKRQSYNQVAAGLETLGKRWDFRANGYFPVGKDLSSYSNEKFHGFSGHHVISGATREFAMKGMNIEAGYHIRHFEQVPIDVFFGPYYLKGNYAATWGGESRISADIFTYLRAEVSGSYDHLFKWKVQGQVGLNIPLGGKRCKKPHVGLAALSVERVYRHEIIPVSKHMATQVAINPATGKPWFFWWVDNTSHSSGTYENPFSTLAAAQNASAAHDVIYVLPGDGTTTGMADGITLKDAQLLLGASVEHTIPTTSGPLVIPPMASQAPHITNNDGFGSGVVYLVNDNVVSGLIITNSNDGVDDVYTIESSGTLNIDRCVLSGNSSNGISIATAVTTANITNNTFLSFPNGSGILIGLGGDVTTCNISNNTFEGIGIPIFVNEGSVDDLNLLKNAFSTMGPFNDGAITNFVVLGNIFDGVGILSRGPITSTTASGNTFSNLSSEAGISFELLTADLSSTLNVTNNTFTATGTPPAVGFATHIHVSNGSLCLNLLNNRATTATPQTAYYLSQSNPGIFDRTTGSDADTNTGTFDTSHGTVGGPGSCSQ